MRRRRLNSLREHPLILPVFVPAMLLAVALVMLVPILPLYVQSFGASYWLVGVVLAGQSLGTVLGDLPSGLVLARLGQKRAMSVGNSLTLVGFLASAFAPTLLMLLLCQMVLGVGLSIFFVSRHAYITQVTELATRGRAMALFGGIMRAGRLFGPWLGGLLANRYGFRLPFVVMAGMVAVVIVCILRFVPADAPRQRAASAENYGAQLFTIWRKQWRIFSSVGVAFLLAQLVRRGPSAIIPLYGADMLGLDVAQIGAVLSLSAAIDFSLFYTSGILMDRFGRKWAIVPGFFIQGIGLALIPFTTSFATLVAAACVITLGNGITSGTMMTLAADLAPEDNPGPFLASWRLLGSGGMAIGPLLVGAVADIVALSSVGFVVGAAGALAAVIFARFVPETLKKPPPVG